MSDAAAESSRDLAPLTCLMSIEFQGGDVIPTDGVASLMANASVTPLSTDLHVSRAGRSESTSVLLGQRRRRASISPATATSPPFATSTPRAIATTIDIVLIKLLLENTGATLSVTSMRPVAPGTSR